MRPRQQTEQSNIRSWKQCKIVCTYILTQSMTMFACSPHLGTLSTGSPNLMYCHNAQMILKLYLYRSNHPLSQYLVLLSLTRPIVVALVYLPNVCVARPICPLNTVTETCHLLKFTPRVKWAGTTRQNKKKHAVYTIFGDLVAAHESVHAINFIAYNG